MSKYKQGILYIGNVKYISEEKNIEKKDVLIFYSEKNDCFYPVDILNYLRDLDNKEKLTEKQLKEIEEIVNTNTYKYSEEDIFNQSYVDENSIALAYTDKQTTNNNLKY